MAIDIRFDIYNGKVKVQWFVTSSHIYGDEGAVIIPCNTLGSLSREEIGRFVEILAQQNDRVFAKEKAVQVANFGVNNFSADVLREYRQSILPYINDDEVFTEAVDIIDRELRERKQRSETTPMKTRNKLAWMYEAVKSELVDRDGKQCAACGSRANLEVDHIHPVSRGGKNDLENLQLLCRSCNRSKKDQTMEEWSSKRKDN